jgi:hypothetical protein
MHSRDDAGQLRTADGQLVNIPRYVGRRRCTWRACHVACAGLVELVANRTRPALSGLNCRLPDYWRFPSLPSRWAVRLAVGRAFSITAVKMGSATGRRACVFHHCRQDGQCDWPSGVRFPSLPSRWAVRLAVRCAFSITAVKTGSATGRQACVFHHRRQDADEANKACVSHRSPQPIQLVVTGLIAVS